MKEKDAKQLAADMRSIGVKEVEAIRARRRGAGWDWRVRFISPIDGIAYGFANAKYFEIWKQKFEDYLKRI